jgi:hypothetical protein
VWYSFSRQDQDSTHIYLHLITNFMNTNFRRNFTPKSQHLPFLSGKVCPQTCLPAGNSEVPGTSHLCPLLGSRECLEPMTDG